MDGAWRDKLARMKRPDRRSAAARTRRTSRRTGTELTAPEVIVDILDDGLLYVSLQNIGDVPAYDVRAASTRRFASP